MNHRARFSVALLGFVCFAVVIGCGGSNLTGGPPFIAPTSPGPATVAPAYLVYPTNAPTVAPGQTPGPVAVNGLIGNGGFFCCETLVFAVQGALGLNSTYQVLVSPAPSNSPGVFTLNSAPTSFPSQVAPPPGPGPFTYVTAQGPNLKALTTYTITLLGCPTNVPCSSPSPAFVGTLQTGCSNIPVPTPLPSFGMALPAAGATGVADNLGQVIVNGSSFDAFGPVTVTLTSALGAVVMAGTPTAVPSPWPSPLSTSASYFEVTVPTLSAATTYTVAVNAPVQGYVPPCAASYPQSIGAFTTQ